MVEVHRQKSTKLARKPVFLAKRLHRAGQRGHFIELVSEYAERLHGALRRANALSVCANDFAGRLHGALRRAFVRNDCMERLHGVPAPGASLPCATLHACCTKPLAPSAGTIYRHHLAARIDRHRALERSGSEGRASCRIMDHKTVRGTAAPI